MTQATKMKMKFGTWNVGCLYRAGSLRTKASELVKCNLDLVAVKEDRWVSDGSQSADHCIFLYGSWNADLHLGTGFDIHKGSMSAVERNWSVYLISS